MRYLPIRRERTVRAIADRVYGDLTPEVRAKAEAALLKENPQLRRMRDLPAGSVVRVPPLEEAASAGRRSVKDPVGEIADDVADMLKAFDKQMTGRFSAAEATVKEQAALLRRKGLAQALKDDVEAVEIAAALKKDLGERAKTLKTRSRDGAKALKELQASLGKLGERG